MGTGRDVRASAICTTMSVLSVERSKVLQRVGPTSPHESQPFVRVEILRERWDGGPSVCLLVQELLFAV